MGSDLKSQRRTHSPLAAHGDAEQSAQHQQHAQRWRKRAGQLDHRKAENVEHQHRPPAIAIGQHPKHQRANGTKRLRQKYGAQHIRRLGVEVRGDRLHAEDQQKKIEAVQRPSQKRCNKRVALRRAQSLEIAKERHEREDTTRLEDQLAARFAPVAGWLLLRQSRRPRCLRRGQVRLLEPRTHVNVNLL